MSCEDNLAFFNLEYFASPAGHSSILIRILGDFFDLYVLTELTINQMSLKQGVSPEVSHSRWHVS